MPSHAIISLFTTTINHSASIVPWDSLLVNLEYLHHNVYFAILMHYVDGLICAYIGYLYLGKDADLPFNFHLEALDWSVSHICGLCDSLSTNCQYGST